jgi:predicted sugar kinase
VLFDEVARIEFEVTTMDPMQVNTPARPHLGLIVMNGEISRIDGGIGLVLESPRTFFEADKTKETRVATLMIKSGLNLLNISKDKMINRLILERIKFL